jgi:hypothetical protein
VQPILKEDRLQLLAKRVEMMQQKKAERQAG